VVVGIGEEWKKGKLVYWTVEQVIGEVGGRYYGGDIN